MATTGNTVLHIYPIPINQ